MSDVYESIDFNYRFEADGKSQSSHKSIEGEKGLTLHTIREAFEEFLHQAGYAEDYHVVIQSYDDGSTLSPLQVTHAKD